MRESVQTGRLPVPVDNATAKVIGPYDRKQMLRLVFGLQPPHLDEKKQFLQDLQTKGSPHFHHFLKPEEWDARFAPSAEDEQAVVNWAAAQGFAVTQRYPNRLMVDLEGPVEAIQKALNVTVNSYQLGAKTFFSNDRNPSIPAGLAGIVSVVAGLNNLESMAPVQKGGDPLANPVYRQGPVRMEGASQSGSGRRRGRLALGKQRLAVGAIPQPGDTFFEPPDLWDSNAYDYDALENLGHCCNPLGNPDASPVESSIAIATSGDFDPDDIQVFASTYGLALNWQSIFIDGTPACCSFETTMDVEWSTAMSNSFGAPSTTAKVFVYIGANATVPTFIDMFNQILTDSNARVLSTSWGAPEGDGWPPEAMDLAHAIFDQMTGEGWTLIASTGDQGATADCQAGNSVNYPASDPDVLAAGGSSLYLSAGIYQSETGWTGGTAAGDCTTNLGGGGGGFSRHFPLPAYQGGLPLPEDLTIDVPGPAALGRAVPDLALNGSHPQSVYFGGLWQASAGTSIVAPELAGFVAQENAYLQYLCQNSNTSCSSFLGNINYALYQEGKTTYAAHNPFYDITSGCNSNDITWALGLPIFCAGAGYDTVTGWGSANMLQLAWALNAFKLDEPGILSKPSVTFSGPPIARWYNSEQAVHWTITAPPRGVAGFSTLWDEALTDVKSQPTPGSGSTFYDGPNDPEADGSAYLSDVGEGCHTVHVSAWANNGYPSGDQTFGPLCYDTTPPVTAESTVSSTSGTAVTLTASDPGWGAASGVSATYYSIDNYNCSAGNLGACLVYTAPFIIPAQGPHTVYVFSEDVAGNFEGKWSFQANVAVTSTVTLMVNIVGNGAVSVAPPSPDGTYRNGTRVCLTATPNTPWLFGAWSGATLDSANCLVMNFNYSVTAIFVQTAAAFADVPHTIGYFDAVNLMFQTGVTTGCIVSNNPATRLFCPNDIVTREQMAAFLVRAVTGTTNPDPALYNHTPFFTDVPSTNGFFGYIQKLMELGITAGCGGGKFCPTDAVPRWQMAIFMVRARLALRDSSFGFTPTPYFADVPTNVEGNGQPFPFIQRSYEEHITTGCGTNPLIYCPDQLVTRWQMASFIMRGLFNKTTVQGPTAPLLTSVGPNSMASTPGSHITAIITGANTSFQAGDTVTIPSGMLDVSNVQINSTTSITATLTTNAKTMAGPQSIVVSSGGQDLTLPLAISVGTY